MHKRMLPLANGVVDTLVASPTTNVVRNLMTPFRERLPYSTIFERNWPMFAIVLIALSGAVLVAFADTSHVTAIVTFLGPVLALLGVAWKQKTMHEAMDSHGEQLDRVEANVQHTKRTVEDEAATTQALITMDKR